MTSHSSQPPQRQPQPHQGQSTLTSLPSPTGDPPSTVPGAQLTPAPPVLDGELLSEEDNAAAAAWLSGHGRLSDRMVMLAQAVIDSPRSVQLIAVIAYRLRNAPSDATRLCWFFCRGNARWIAKGWTWATHGDLRADARAARLIGDREARRAAQELIRTDAATRWAKLGIAAHRIALGGLLIAFLGGILAITNAYVDRAEMPA